MNVLNGIFVNAAVQSSRLNRELATDNQMRERTKLVQQIAHLFFEADRDNSGNLSWDEFLDFMDDEEVQAYFLALDLDMSSLDKIFVLLDKDDTGNIDLMEFLDGCLRLKGVAKTVDIVMLKNELDHIARTLERTTRQFEAVGLTTPSQRKKHSRMSIQSSTSSATEPPASGTVWLKTPTRADAMIAGSNGCLSGGNGLETGSACS